VAGLLFFFPNAKGSAKSEASAAGLDALLSYIGGSVGCLSGPSGEPGVIVAQAPHAGSDGKAADCGYYPEKQTWSSAANGAYWIGFETQAPPRPQDLLRTNALAGHFVELEDGNQWLVPIARSPIHKPTVPRPMVRDAQGNWVESDKPVPRYADFCNRVDKCWQAFSEATEGQDVIFVDGVETAIAALEANYFLNDEVVSALGLLSSANYIAVIMAAFDWPTVKAVSEAFLKKKAAEQESASPPMQRESEAPDTSNTGAGAPD